MKTVQHHAIILTHYSGSELRAFRARILAGLAFERVESLDYRSMVGGIVSPSCNSYHHFLIILPAATGAWPVPYSHEFRASVIEAAKAAGIGLVEVAYGEVELSVWAAGHFRPGE